ncbi:MAG: DUF2892 domain-containing protein [Bacteroidota bacterium]
MKANLGYIDRMLRAILGGAVMAVGIYFSTWWGVVGGIVFLTSVFSFCPLYYIGGMNSAKEHYGRKSHKFHEL